MELVPKVLKVAPVPASSQPTPLPVEVSTCPSVPCAPPTVKLSVSKTPSMSTLPLISKVAASNSPVIVKFLKPV